MKTVVAFLAGLATAVVAGAGPVPEFAARFHDRTMRIDLHHTGNAAEEHFTVDRIWEQGSWAGSRSNLIDPFGVGRYAVTLRDAASGELLFSRGFDSYFGEYRTTADAIRGVRRTYHESVLVPFPKGKVRLGITVAERGTAGRVVLDSEVDPASYAIHREPLRDGVTVVELARGGDPHACVDLAIVGEGYTAAEEPKFRADAARVAQAFLGHEPFARLRQRFNVRGVLAPSQQSGCDEPSRGVHRNTAVGASFDSLGIERYVLTEDNRALRDIAAHVPYDALLILVNHSRYGGGGIYNLFCTATSENQWTAYTVIHELGHTLFGLADEYYTSAVAYNDLYPRGVEPAEANITALLDPAALKWKDLLTPGVAVPTRWEKEAYDTMDRGYQKVREELSSRIAAAMRAGAPAAEVEALKAEAERLSTEHARKVDAFLARSAFAGKVGVFEGAGYSSEGLYRAMVDCIMFTKGVKPFCRVCERAIERVVAHHGE